MKAIDWLINLVLWARIHILIMFNYPFNMKPKRLHKTHELTFLDDFNKSELLRDNWRTDHWWGERIHPGNIVDHNMAPKVIYTDINHIIVDGKIHMFTKKENIPFHYVDYDGKDWGTWNIPYSSGQIQQQSFEQLYGYFEANIAIPSTPGTWPAFWLASRHSWPPEIDIFEFYTGRQSNYFASNLHFDFKPNKKTRISLGYNFKHSDKQNTWAVDWQENYMKFYWNNILIRVVHEKKVLDFFKFPMFVIINNGVDTGEGRHIEEMESPNFTTVDWVRIWKKKVTN